MLLEYPKKYMISSGIGKDEHHLVSFDSALIDAKISNYNLLRVSSILPIQCEIADKVEVKEGSPLLVAYGSISSNKEGDVISSAVAVGVPRDKASVGVIMEYSGHCHKERAEKIVREMTVKAMQNHGIEIEKINSSAIEGKVDGKEFVSVISAVSMW